jgi:hypothetical protein
MIVAGAITMPTPGIFNGMIIALAKHVPYHGIKLAGCKIDAKIG